MLKLLVIQCRVFKITLEFIAPVKKCWEIINLLKRYSVSSTIHIYVDIDRNGSRLGIPKPISELLVIQHRIFKTYSYFSGNGVICDRKLNRC